MSAVPNSFANCATELDCVRAKLNPINFSIEEHGGDGQATLAAGEGMRKWLMSEFAPLAERIVDALGGPDFIPDPGNPPSWPDWHVRDRAGDLAGTLTGTHNTDEAAKRLLWWAAAANNPSRFNRTKASFPGLMGTESRKLICPCPSWNKRTAWRAVHQPWEWVDELLEDEIAAAEKAGAVRTPALGHKKSTTPGASPTEKRRRGRRKADYKTQQEESALVANWEQARAAGVYKASFAR